MKKHILLGVMLISSCIDTPKTESIRFIDDRTIEYENEFSLGVGNYGYSGYDVKLLSLDPNNGTYVKRNVHSSTKGKIYFSKDIPDGSWNFFISVRTSARSHTLYFFSYFGRQNAHYRKRYRPKI